jgi:hypothetical protein
MVEVTVGTIHHIGLYYFTIFNAALQVHPCLHFRDVSCEREQSDPHLVPRVQPQPVPEHHQIEGASTPFVALSILQDDG